LDVGSFVENLVVFGRLLRRVGFEVPVGRILDLTEALTYIDLNARDEVLHTCRALLVQRHEQLAAFREVFDAFWRDHTNPFGRVGRGSVRRCGSFISNGRGACSIRHPWSC
jgi:uncharacterized protein with von Willebrand factor type A (vWA) domain